MKAKKAKEFDGERDFLAPVPKAAAGINVSVHSLRAAIALGQIEVVRIGRRDFVKMLSLRKLVGAA